MGLIGISIGLFGPGLWRRGILVPRVSQGGYILIRMTKRVKRGFLKIGNLRFYSLNLKKANFFQKTI